MMDAVRMSRLAGLDGVPDSDMSDPVHDFIRGRERVDETIIHSGGDLSADVDECGDLMSQKIQVDEARLRRIVSREIRAVIDELRRSGGRLVVTQRPRRHLIR